MKFQTIRLSLFLFIALTIFSALVNIKFANASVICVDKYNYTSVIPCSDQNAVDKATIKLRIMETINSSLPQGKAVNGTSTTSNISSSGQSTCRSNISSVACTFAACQNSYNQNPAMTSVTCLDDLGENIQGAKAAGETNITPGANGTAERCLERFGQDVYNQHGPPVTICAKEAYPHGLPG